MKQLGIAKDFKSQMITIDDITLPEIASTQCAKAKLQLS
jgi:hypothetical protein